MSDYFKIDNRANGEAFVKLADDAPEWVLDAVREAHDGEFPDDWRYEMCERIFDGWHDGDWNPDDDDSMYEFADAAVDIYNMARLQWLAGHLERAAYCDEAVAEYGWESIGDTYGLIGVGQLFCIRQMVDTIARAIVDNHETEDA